MKEALEKALHDIQFAHENLRNAFQTANRVERIVLRGLIMQVRDLEREVGEFVLAQRDEEMYSLEPTKVFENLTIEMLKGREKKK